MFDPSHSGRLATYQYGVNPTCSVSGFDQTTAGVQSYHVCMGNLAALCVHRRGYVRYGCGGTIIVILVIVWLVRRA